MVQKSRSARSGRPLGFDPEAVLGEVTQLFWERGFDATSLDDIEERTGLSRSSLYNSFGTKHDLFADALEHYQRWLAERLLGPLEHGVGGLDDVRDFVGLLAQRLDDPGAVPGCLLVNSMTELGGANAEVARQARVHVERSRRALAAALERAVELGEIERDGLEARVDLLVLAVLGLNVAARAALPRSQVDALVDGLNTEITSWARRPPKRPPKRSR